MGYSSRIPQIMRAAERRIDAANRRTAERIALDAAATVPRDTGRTALSIDARRTDDGDYEVTVDFPGSMIEFGSSKKAARPFLTPAAEARRDDHRRAVRDAYES